MGSLVIVHLLCSLQVVGINDLGLELLTGGWQNATELAAHHGRGGQTTDRHSAVLQDAGESAATLGSGFLNKSAAILGSGFLNNVHDGLNCFLCQTIGLWVSMTGRDML